MKWRQSLVYLIILLLVGGYFYYFEIVEKERKETAEKERKKVFHFSTDIVRSIEIFSREHKPLLLKKETRWQIVEPFQSEVDSGSLEDFLITLAGLEAEKDIAPSAEDLKPYGLQEPALRIRFQAGEQWLELLLGEMNPIGEGYYARTAEKPGLFLVAAGNWGSLNKNINELRRRDLFAFSTKDVEGIQVTWQDGKSARIEHQEDDNSWKDPGRPGIKIKNSKVENLLEQIHWLRAKSFLENEPINLNRHGLEPPFVTVDLRLKKERTVELRLGKKDKDEKQLSALSSELRGVVEVDSNILKELPTSVEALEDRSLVGVAKDEIKQVKWNVGENQIHVVQLDGSKWGLRRGDAQQPEPLKESWHVKSLLWNLNDSEYQRKLDPMPTAPVKPHVRLELWDAEKRVVALLWEKSTEGGVAPVVVWIEREKSRESVEISPEAIRKIEEDLARFLQPEGIKKGS